MRCAASKLALGLVRLLIGLCGCTFLFYCVAITVTAWRHSRAYRNLTTITTFPFIALALPEHFHISKHREFSSAVRSCASPDLQNEWLHLLIPFKVFKSVCTPQVWFLWGSPFLAAVLTIVLRRACAWESLCKKDHEDQPIQVTKQQDFLAITKSAVGSGALSYVWACMVHA